MSDSAVVIAICVLIGVGACLFLYHEGYQKGVAETQAKAQKEVDKANLEVQAKSERIEQLDRELEDRVKERDEARSAELANAKLVLKPVRLCNNNSSSTTVPGVPTTSGGTQASRAGPELPVPAERDIGPALVMLANRCDGERDRAINLWNAWNERAKIAREKLH